MKKIEEMRRWERNIISRRMKNKIKDYMKLLMLLDRVTFVEIFIFF